MPAHRFLIAAAVLPLLAQLVAPMAALPAYATSAGANNLAACAENPLPALLAQYPKGGADLAAAIAALVATEPCGADYVIAAADTALPAIVAALAAGLAQAAASLALTDLAAAQRILGAIYRSGNQSLAAAFSVAYSAALAASPASLALLEGTGLPPYSPLQGNNLVSPH